MCYIIIKINDLKYTMSTISFIRVLLQVLLSTFSFLLTFNLIIHQYDHFI